MKFTGGLSGVPTSTGQGIHNLNSQIEKQRYGEWPTVDNPSTSWIRPLDWLSLGTIESSDQKLIGLYAVTDDDGNFVALSVEADYTVNWGDGIVEDYNSGEQAEHQYVYADISSSTLSSRGYRQVLITVTPQVDQDLTSIDITKRHSAQEDTGASASKWLDVVIAGPNLTSIILRSSELSWAIPNALEGIITMLEQVRILSSALTSYENLFLGCTALQSVQITSSQPVTSTASMFSSCTSMINAPLFETNNVEDMNLMFSYCNALKNIPLYNTTNVTNMNSMFYECFVLENIPYIITSNVTDMSNMFYNCNSLNTVPLFDTYAVTDMSYMFYACWSLTSIPWFYTVNVTSMSYMFYACWSLNTVPLFDTSSVTDMSYMFYRCLNLKSVPLLNTSSAINLDGMLLDCANLISVPLFDLSSCTSMQTILGNCISLINIPEWDVSTSKNIEAGYNFSLTKVDAKGATEVAYFYGCNLSTNELEKIMNNLGAPSESWSEISIGDNRGASPVITLEGSSTNGSTTVTMASTDGLEVGMEITGDDLRSSTTSSISGTNLGSTWSFASLPEEGRISFATDNNGTWVIALATTSGYSSTTTFYYTTDNDFSSYDVWQSCGTIDGSIYDITTDGTTWVAVGRNWPNNAPVVVYCDDLDGGTWVTSDPDITNGSCRVVKTDGEGTWVLITWQGHVRYTNDLTEIWLPVGSDLLDENSNYFDFNNIAYNAGIWAICGQNKSGIHYTKDSDLSETWSTVNSSYQIRDIAIGNDGLIGLINTNDRKVGWLDGNILPSISNSNLNLNLNWSTLSTTIMPYSITTDGNGVWCIYDYEEDDLVYTTDIKNDIFYGSSNSFVNICNNYNDINGLKYGSGRWVASASGGYSLSYVDDSNSISSSFNVPDDTVVTFTSDISSYIVGIKPNTAYYVVNSSSNTFQVAATPGVNPLNLINTRNNTTMNLNTTITAINPNTSITLSIPAASTGTSQTYSSKLKRSIATLRGWTVNG